MKAVPSEKDLDDLLQHAEAKGIKVAAFREPDLANALTAIALCPGPKTEALCRGIPLALRGR